MNSLWILFIGEEYEHPHVIELFLTEQAAADFADLTIKELKRIDRETYGHYDSYVETEFWIKIIQKEVHQ